jgi:hypothetical protein
MIYVGYGNLRKIIGLTTNATQNKLNAIFQHDFNYLENLVLSATFVVSPQKKRFVLTVKSRDHDIYCMY